MNAALNHSRLQFGGPSRITSRHGANGHRSSKLAISSPGLSSTLELRTGDQPHSSGAVHSVTPRDVAILMALDSYRYLDRNQIQTLFFTGPRSCQYRLRWLVHHGLVHTWRVVMRPGRVCRASIFLLSRRGAAALAEWIDDEPLAYVRRAEHALERRFHLVHQLEANQFFVDLAAVTRGLSDHGLYHWVGEHGVATAYAEGDEQAPIPDGWGRLLTPDREVLIHLEWDRGTEQARRLRAKVIGYAAYFTDRPGAGANQVLFVAPTEERERQILSLIRDYGNAERESCRFWTTTTAFIAASGSFGDVWAGGGSRRVGLKAMDGLPRSERDVDASVGKPGWWLRRPGGGAGS
jgi:protein involved in plasmid replication-relaxation